MLIPYFNQKIAALNAYADTLANRNIYASNSFGFARSLLAFGTLITFLFSPYDAVFVDSIHKTAFVDVLNSINLFDLIKTPAVARITACVILLSVISGYLPQLTSILHWWLCFSMFNKGTLVDGGDQVSMILSFFLMPLALLDPRLNHWSTGKPYNRPYTNIFANFMLNLIAIQMSAIYFHSFVEKLKVTEWVNGTAVYYFLNNNLFGPVPFVKNIITYLLSNQYIALISDWGVLLLEILLFAAIFMNPKNKRRMLVTGILFHASIIILHGLVSFFFAMAAGLFIYLYPLETNIVTGRFRFRERTRKKEEKETAAAALQTI